MPSTEEVIKQIISSQQINSPMAVLMCGVAGSGKTTFAKELEQYGFIRLSIDEEIWKTNGKYGIDFSPLEYEDLKETAEKKLRLELCMHVKNKKNTVVDFSFWQRQRRNEYKQLIEDRSGYWRLVYLKVPSHELRRRLVIRSKRFDANAAFPITEEILASYLKGFEEPDSEGEIVIE